MPYFCSLHKLLLPNDECPKCLQLTEQSKNKLNILQDEINKLKSEIVDYRKTIHQFIHDSESVEPTTEHDESMCDPHWDAYQESLERIWIKFIQDWEAGQTNSGLGKALQDKFETLIKLL